MDSIKISNFRKIKESWEFDLAPITFFTGKNSSGKSSVLKGMMVLNDYINSDNHFFLNFDGEFANKHNVKAFDEAKNWNNKDSKQIKFELKNKESLVELVFEDIEEEEYFRLVRQYFRHSSDDFALEQGRIKRGVLNVLKITRSDGKVFSILRTFGLEYQIVVDPDLISNTTTRNIRLVDSSLIQAEVDKLVSIINDKFDLPQIDSLEEIFNIEVPVKLKTNRDWISIIELSRVLLQKKNATTKKVETKKSHMYNPSFTLAETFDNDKLLIDRVIIKTLLQYFEIESNKKDNDIGSFDKKTEANKLLSFSEWVIDQLSFDIYHLSPNRANQSKIYNILETNNDINNLLRLYSKSPFFNYDAESFLNDTLDLFEIPRLESINLIEENLYSIKLSDASVDGVHLKDQGYGIGQLFVIIFQVALLLKQRLFENKDRKQNKKIIIIEEPEANLHPALQSELTKFFVNVHHSYGIHFILETHSEYMIRKSQLLNLEVSKGNNELFALYYFGENGPYKMNYNKEGRFDKDFGKGFFDEAAKTAIRIMKLAKEQK